MSEDITKGTRYFNALRDVSDAARKVEEARVKYEDTLDQLTKEMGQAKQTLREALQVAAELTGESLPVSERDKATQHFKDVIRDIDGKKPTKS